MFFTEKEKELLKFVFSQAEGATESVDDEIDALYQKVKSLTEVEEENPLSSLKFYMEGVQIDESHVETAYVSVGEPSKTFKEITKEAKEQFWVEISYGKEPSLSDIIKSKLEQNGYFELDYKDSVWFDCGDFDSDFVKERLRDDLEFREKVEDLRGEPLTVLPGPTRREIYEMQMEEQMRAKEAERVLKEQKLAIEREKREKEKEEIKKNLTGIDLELYNFFETANENKKKNSW